YEMANYTVVDGTHLQMTLNKAHNLPATVAMGGLCGYGLEQTVDTASGIRQVFPVVGSYSATGLYYAGGATAIVGAMGHSSAFLNLSLNVASIARSNNVVTVTTAGNLPADVNGLTLTVSGVADSGYNGSYAVTTTGPNTLTYAQSGANSTSTGGTMAVLTGGYALYPMAEVLSVLDAATKSVDGQMTLAPNTVAWAANDALEQPHYFQELVSADLTYVGQTTPRPTSYVRAGLQYEGNNGPGLQGWTVTNATPSTAYLGNGGTHIAPDWAYEAKGVWNRTMSLQAGEQSVFTVHCNSHGCGKWNSHYNLFELDSSVATDTISFQPTTSTLTLGLRGTTYGFSPQAFTAATVNAGTVNATILNGAVSAAQLPVFQASGSGHAQGVVPDPGATAGTTRFLREDGTWAAPSGGSTGLGTGTGPGFGMADGATADYNFLQGSGSVATDGSGNGNDGTLGSGANAPTWTPLGLSFQPGQGVALPSALNGTQTFFVAVYNQPLTAGAQTTNAYPVLITSSLGNSGANLVINTLNSSNNYLTSALTPGVFTNSMMSSCNTSVAGFHVIAYQLGVSGSNVDHEFVDGAECAYTAQGATGLLQSSGHFTLGSSGSGPFAASGILGTVYRLRTYPTLLSATSVTTLSKLIAAEVASRGVGTSPGLYSSALPQINCIGDSITVGQGATTPYCSLISLTNYPSFSAVNWGIGSTTTIAIASSESQRVAPRCQTAFGPAVATVFLGTNDYALTTPATSYTVVTNLIGEVQTLKSAGCRVFVVTMLSRNGFDVNKNAYDAQILQLAEAGGADGVIDAAADPLIGADSAFSNTTYFQADGIHPTNAGHVRIANAFNNTLNYYFGYKASNPHVIAGTTVTLASGDRAVTAAPTGNAAYTMPDCTGPSGATYTISNPQSAFTLTIAGGAGQPINGLSSAVTIPSNSTVTLRDVANPKSTSGCHWVM
ncbi:MAG TPA: SGNH/GDSL hydrolase family protein, partial [Edaphobacter sp.]